MDDRLITSTMQFDDNEVENVLRPKSMSSFVGQDKIKNNLENNRFDDKKIAETVEKLWLL